MITRYEQKNKNGTVYVFECENKYFPELHQTRKVNRRLIGIKGENGEIIPTREKKTKGEDDPDTIASLSSDVKRLTKQLEKANEKNEALTTEVLELREQVKKYQRGLKKLNDILSDIEAE